MEKKITKLLRLINLKKILLQFWYVKYDVTYLWRLSDITVNSSCNNLLPTSENYHVNFLKMIYETPELKKLPPRKNEEKSGRLELAAQPSHRNDFLNFRLEPFNWTKQKRRTTPTLFISFIFVTKKLFFSLSVWYVVCFPLFHPFSLSLHYVTLYTLFIYLS